MLFWSKTNASENNVMKTYTRKESLALAPSKLKLTSSLNKNARGDITQRQKNRIGVDLSACESKEPKKIPNIMYSVCHKIPNTKQQWRINAWMEMCIGIGMNEGKQGKSSTSVRSFILSVQIKYTQRMKKEYEPNVENEDIVLSCAPWKLPNSCSIHREFEMKKTTTSWKHVLLWSGMRLIIFLTPNFPKVCRVFSNDQKKMIFPSNFWKIHRNVFTSHF